MKKSLFVLPGVALAATGALAQEATPLAVSKVALRADALSLFAPRGWKTEKRVTGDLNRDKKPDAALILVENKAAQDAEGMATSRGRALVVALREGKGWRRAGFNHSLLLGTRDGGAFYGVLETPVNVSIRNGVLNVNQESGSRDVLETTHKFRLDRRLKRFFLIGFDSTDRDRLSGQVNIVSANYLTGVRKTEVMEAENGKARQKTARVSRKLRRLEDIKGDERYAE